MRMHATERREHQREGQFAHLGRTDHELDHLDRNLLLGGVVQDLYNTGLTQNMCYMCLDHADSTASTRQNELL